MRRAEPHRPRPTPRARRAAFALLVAGAPLAPARAIAQARDAVVCDTTRVLVPTDTVHRVVHLTLGGALPKAGTPMRGWSELLLQEVAMHRDTLAAIAMPELARSPVYLDPKRPPEDRGPDLAADVSATIDRNGRVLLTMVSGQSGSPQLDALLVNALARADSLGAIAPVPLEYERAVVNVRLQLRSRPQPGRPTIPLFRTAVVFTGTTVPPKPATVITGTAPRYPANLLRRGVTGGAIAQFVVGRDGQARMETLRFLEFDATEFADAVRAALPTYRFTPALAAGCPTPQLVQYPFAFNIARRPSPPERGPGLEPWPPGSRP